MKTEEIALSRVSENEANPRTITEANFQKLVKSILVFPKMLQLRPIVVDETYKALGGNMRTRALCHIVSMTPEAIMDVLDTDQRLTDAEKLAIANYWSQWKEQPTATIVKASDLTEAQKKEFIIKDNAGFGDWDTDALANQWNTDLLKDWGIQDWQLQGWMSPDSLKNGEQVDEDQKEQRTMSSMRMQRKSHSGARNANCGNSESIALCVVTPRMQSKSSSLWGGKWLICILQTHRIMWLTVMMAQQQKDIARMDWSS